MASLMSVASEKNTIPHSNNMNIICQFIYQTGNPFTFEKNEDLISLSTLFEKQPLTEPLLITRQ